MLTGFLLNGPEEEFGAYFLGFGAVAVCQWGCSFSVWPFAAALLK